MARRKKTTIDLEKLEIYSLLIKELRENPNYTDKDLTTLELTVLNNYEPVIKDIDKAITHLQRYVAANKNFIETYKDEQLINRIQLARMLHISRQTLTEWINKGFITPMKSKYFPKAETFNTNAVLKELQNYKAKHLKKEL